MPKWALSALLLIWGFPAIGETPHRVRAGKNLNAIVQDIKATTQRGLHVIYFEAYRNVGTFDLDYPDSVGGIRPDTIEIRRGTLLTDTVLEVFPGTPFIRIRNWKGDLRIRNLAFRITSPAAVVLDGGNNPAATTGSLTLDSCLIFADQLGSNVLQWLADGGKRVEIRRSHIVASRGSNAFLTLGGPTVALHNNVLNFSGTLKATATENFTLAYNTFSRVQVDANGTFNSAGYRVQGNLVTFAPGQNYLGLPAGPRYFMAALAFDTTVSTLAQNRIYRGSGWAGFDLPMPNSRFTSAAGNDSVPRYARPDTTELWNWGLTGDTARGFLAGEGARPNPYNVFPGDSSRTLALPDGMNARFSFQTSFIPRTLKPAFTGALPPADSSYAPYRFLWTGKGALTLDGPFRLDTLRLMAPAVHGNPILVAAAGDNTFSRQNEGVLENDASMFFTNEMGRATQFHAAFRCNTRAGSNVTPEGMGFSSNPDTVFFTRVQQAGRTLWTLTSGPDNLAANIRYLNRTINLTSTALFESGSTMRFGSRQYLAPYLSDSVKWQNKITGTLYASEVGGGTFLASAPAEAPFAAHLVERLSVPRGRTQAVFRFGWGMAKALSDAGFQLVLDSSGSVDSSQFGYVSAKPVAAKWWGRGAGDSVKLEMKVPDSLELWKLPLTGAALQVTTAWRRGDTLDWSVTRADSGARFLSGLRLNILGNQNFSGLVNGFQVDSLRSTTPGRLKLDTLSSSSVNSVDAAQNTRFLGGVSISMRLLRLQREYTLSFGILPPYRGVGGVKVWAFRPATGWTAHTQFLLTQAGAHIRISELDSAVRTLLVVEEFGAPPGIQTTTQVRDMNGKKVVTFRNAGTQGRITHFRVLARSVDSAGTDDTAQTARTAFADSATLTLNSHAYHVLTARFFKGDTLEGINELPVPAGLEVDKARQQSLSSKTLARGWQLVGLPGGGLVAPRYQVLKPNADTVDRKEAYGLKRVGAGYAWDTLRPDLASVTQGKALLFGGTLAYKLELESAVKPSMKNDTMRDTVGGWRLIANPFPFPVRASKLRSSLGQPLANLRRLDVADSQTRNRSYSWQPVEANRILPPFTGYAYHFQRGESLIWHVFTPATAAKTAASGPALVLKAKVGALAAAVRLGDGEREMPALPGAGDNLDLRLGPEGRFWRKPASLQGFVEPVLLRSPEGGVANISAVMENRAMPELLLWDSLGGLTYTTDRWPAVPVSRGENRFLLIGGSAEFVGRWLEANTSAPQAAHFSARALGRDLRVEIRLPPHPGGYARFEITLHDMRGKVRLRKNLGRIGAGSSGHALALPDLGTGMHFCRIRVLGSGGGPAFTATRKVFLP